MAQIAMDEHDRHELNAPGVIGETIDGEVMVIDLDSGAYFSVTGAGATVWPWLIAGATPMEIAAASTGVGDARTLAVRIGTFAARLRAENILRVRNADDPCAADVPSAQRWAGETGEFGLERFDDMRAMLLADPVHDVGERGWPDLATSKSG